MNYERDRKAPVDPSSLRQRVLTYITDHPGKVTWQIKAAFPGEDAHATLCALRGQTLVERRDGKHFAVAKFGLSYKMRECITGCGRTFKSQHVGHRMCDDCRRMTEGAGDRYAGSGGRRVPVRSGA